MDHSEDVGRLFSWIKAPMVRYREFLPQVEVAEAVATWPLVHKTAVETGVASAEETMPQGDFLAHQRIARDRLGLGELATKAIQEAPLTNRVVMPEANEPRAMPSSDRLVAALGQRVQAAKVERETGVLAAPSPLAPSAGSTSFAPVYRTPASRMPQATIPAQAAPPLAGTVHEAPPPSLAPTAQPLGVFEDRIAEDRYVEAAPPVSGFDDPRMAVTPSAARLSSNALPPSLSPRQARNEPLPSREPLLREPPLREPAAQPASPDRGGLFSGEYRGRERDDRPRGRPADRQDRSLDAVFTRLSGQRDSSLPDPRSRGRTSPGLGSVFNRLR